MAQSKRRAGILVAGMPSRQSALLGDDELQKASIARRALEPARELDTEVLALNREAYERLHCVKELRPAGRHASGALDEVSAPAAEWFRRYLLRLT
jgi:hypothetical protein